MNVSRCTLALYRFEFGVSILGFQFGGVNLGMRMVPKSRMMIGSVMLMDISVIAYYMVKWIYNRPTLKYCICSARSWFPLYDSVHVYTYDLLFY